jgi:GNAT superfamily N-acetyltransferase
MRMNLAFDLPGFKLRPLDAKDVADFVELGLPTCAFMHGRPRIPQEVMRKRFASFVKEHAFEPDSSIFVVESPEGRIVAQIWLRSTVNRFNGVSELWVWDLTVLRGYQAKGVGRALLTFAKERAAELGTPELWLLVSSRNSRALRIYGQAGLRAAGHLMAMPLDSPTFQDGDIKVNQATIRPLRSYDVKLLHKLWKAAGLPFRPHGRDREDRLGDHLDGPQIGAWGAFISDVLVAAAIISNDGRKGWIERVATQPQHRKTGLARALVAAAVQSLKDDGALVIAALVEEENTPSRRLFESLGFVDSPTLLYYSLRDNPAC